MKDEIEFKKFMSGICELFDKKLTSTLSDIYWKSLEGVSDKDAAKGFSLVFTNCKFFPKPVELLELMSDQSVTAIEDKALTIAHGIVSHLKFNGATKRPDLSSDPVAHHLMITRWNYPNWASQVLDSELKWWVKEFCEAYRAYENIPDQIEMTKPLKQLVAEIG